MSAAGLDGVESLMLPDSASIEGAYQRQRRGTLQLLVGRGCFFASAYVVAAIAARRLGAIDYGIYGVIMSLLLWVEMIATANIPAIAKVISGQRYDAGQTEASARVFLVGSSALLFGVCWLLAPLLANAMGIPNGTLLFRIAALDLPLAFAYASYEGGLYGHRRFGVVALAQAGLAAARLLGLIVLVAIGFSVQRLLLVIVSSTLVVYTALIVRRRWPPRSPAFGIIAEIAAIAAPMGVYLIGTQVLVNLDLWSLKSFWRGEGEVVGQYVASVNLARMLTLIPFVQAGILFTSIAWATASKDMERARRHIQESTRFALILSVAACVIVGGEGEQLLSALFSNAYAAGYRFLRLQLAAFSLFALLDVFCWSLMAAGRKWVAASTLITLVPVAAITNYVLISRLGPIGAAISMLIANAAAAAVTGTLAARQFGPVARVPTIVRVSLAAAAVGLVGGALTAHGLLLVGKLVLLAVLYLLVLYGTGEITRKDFALGARHAAGSEA